MTDKGETDWRENQIWFERKHNGWHPGDAYLDTELIKKE